jgi:hypothetical protein
MTTKAKAGEVWNITHSRKGDLTVRFPKDFDAETDGFSDIEIVAGRVTFMSETNRFAQRVNGLGTEGDTITVRNSFVTLLSPVAA